MNINQETQKKEKEKKRVLESAKKLSDVRDEIIDLFEKGTFPYKGNVFQTKKRKIRGRIRRRIRRKQVRKNKK